MASRAPSPRGGRPAASPQPLVQPNVPVRHGAGGHPEKRLGAPVPQPHPDDAGPRLAPQDAARVRGPSTTSSPRPSSVPVWKASSVAVSGSYVNAIPVRTGRAPGLGHPPRAFAHWAHDHAAAFTAVPWPPRGTVPHSRTLGYVQATATAALLAAA